MILHLDMDAFYASVEQLDNPQLLGKCVIIGGTSGRGVVSTASYEARKFGVHSAMPIFQARQKCPDAIFITPRMGRYKALSRQIMTILNDFSPLVEPVSIDEAFLDVSGCQTLFGSPVQMATALKKQIKKETGLTCSVGVAPVRFLAKIASDMEKPDGLTIIYSEEVKGFIETLPIQKVSGVGSVAREQLHRMNIKTLGDVKRYSILSLEKRLGKFGLRLHGLSLGIDNTPITPRSAAKSVSTEDTLSEDTRDMDLLKRYLLRQSQEVGLELRRLKVRARTITLKIKHADFKLVTRSSTLAVPTNVSASIYSVSVSLLEQYELKGKIRLIGVGASGLLKAGTPVQLDMFSREREKGDDWEKVDKTMDKIMEKFGKNAVRRATLARKDS
jgi:DNA polymerase IV